MKMFMVGGIVRDEIMGVRSNDVDFTVVMEDSDFPGPGTVVYMPDAFSQMEAILTRMGFKIFESRPDFLTVRAQFPTGTGDFDVTNLSGGPANPGKKRLTADFVLARKEGDYTDGRRPDKVELGSLEDDLARRDFTMNAIAKDTDGTLIDPFNGQADIAQGVIRAVGDAHERLSEDALRALRALRFSVTKGFRIDPGLAFAMRSVDILDKVEKNIADDRKRVEIEKMFAHDTVASLLAMNEFPALTAAAFSGSVSLTATMKKKGRS